jgi:N-acyl-D-amino-acid deacylase
VDLLFRGAEVFSGDGPAIVADVAVDRGLIAEIRHGLPLHAERVVEAQGLMLCPGFIDMHAHSALEPFHDPRLLPKVAQGFTTELICPDGLAPAPVSSDWEQRQAYIRPLEGRGPQTWNWSTLEEFMRELNATLPATSLVASVGHNAVRDCVLGSARRTPTTAELSSMRNEVRLGAEAGAKALSFGLIYLPGVFANPHELIEISREAAAHGLPLVPHVRNEGADVLTAVSEMVEVARASGASLNISHLKVVGNADLAEPLLELIDKAGRDVDVTFDQYPYGAGSTILTALLPPWAQEGGARAILARLREESQQREIARDVERGLKGWENLYRACGPERIFIADAGPEAADTIGKTLWAIAAERGMEPFKVVLDLLSETKLNALMIDHYATEETVRTIFRHPAALVGSDAIFSAKPHPRLYGTAARVLGRYAIRERLISIEDAVARLTSRAADRLHLTDRGRIKAGLRADLVLIDPKTYVDTATYEEPEQVPSGVKLVLVAGQEVWPDHQPERVLPGSHSRGGRAPVRTET